MKNLILLSALTFFTLNTFANTDISDALQNAENFQFYHCETKNTENFLNHYIIDVRNSEVSVLYGSNEIGKMLGKNLKQLQLMDENLLNTNDSQFDISLKSSRNPLFIGLVIKDSDGQYLEGKIVLQNQFANLKCKDITTEK